ncbi:hypothetical protein ABKN59_009361 [Abortiporus biennis]
MTCNRLLTSSCTCCFAITLSSSGDVGLCPLFCVIFVLVNIGSSKSFCRFTDVLLVLSPARTISQHHPQFFDKNPNTPSEYWSVGLYVQDKAIGGIKRRVRSEPSIIPERFLALTFG